MHRSGTSAVAGALYRTGVHFGKSIESPSYDNPRGFYENYRIQDLNDEIFKTLNSSWSDVELLPVEWWKLPEIIKLENKAHKIIRKEYGNHALFSIKDPRISVLLPFWKRVLRNCNTSVLVLLSIRQPQDIVSSLKKRNFFSEDKSNLLIAKHLLLAQLYSDNTPQSIIDYNEFLLNPIDSIKVTFEELKLKVTIDSNVENEIKKYVSPDLRNFSTSEDIRSIKVTKDPQDITDTIYQSLREKGYLDTLELEKKLDSYSQILEAVSPLEDNFWCKLLIDYGSGYSEKNALIQRVDEGIRKIEFSLPNESNQAVCGLRFFPANSECSLDLNSMDFLFEGESEPYALSNNAHTIEGKILYFNTPFPQIIVTFKKKQGVSIKSLHIELEYLSLGRSNIESHDSAAITKNNRKGNSEYTDSLLLVLKYPFRFISSINQKNFRTLRSALKRESPQQILRNFKKLLTQKDHQKLIEEKGRASQSEFFDEKEILKDNNKEDTIVWSPQEKDRYKRRSILYVVPSLPEFDTSSGGKRATRMLTMLAKEHDVSLCSLGPIVEKYEEVFTRQSVSVLETHKLEHQGISHIDVVIFAWYYIWFEAAYIRDLYPNAITIIDTVDIHWIREERSINIVKEMDSVRVAKNKTRELRAYSEVDLIWVVSEPDKEAILMELPVADVRIVSNIHDAKILDYIDPDTNNLLFFGGFTHYPNISAVQILATEIFPNVRLKVPEAKLLIAGANAPLEVSVLEELEGVTFLGFIEEQHVAELYQKTKLCVAPLLMGAGIKGKICEAIEYRTPVATNAIGNEGIDLIHGKSGIIVEGSNELSKHIISVLCDEYDLDQMTRLAQEQLSSIVGPDVVQSEMVHSFYRNIDICIVTWNRKDLLEICIDSVLSNTLYPNYNIIVYSNGCRDGTVAYLEELEVQHLNVHAIYSDNNDVFVRPNNKMMEINNRHDVVLLNNDVVVTSGWLYGLYDTAYSNSAIGVVGSKILNPDGSLQEFGAELYEDGTGMNIGRGDKADLPEYNGNRAVGYVSGCSMFMKRSTIDKIGVFDDHFHPCYCEDSDYCYTAWEHDLQTLVTSSSTIYHNEGSTSGIDEENGFKRYQTINMEKFWQKHQSKNKRTRKSIKKANSLLKQESSRPKD